MLFPKKNEVKQRVTFLYIKGVMVSYMQWVLMIHTYYNTGKAEKYTDV